MRVLLFDNYDSFTYNLAHQLSELGVDYDVARNDKIELDTIDQYDKIILSPGPGIPEEAGILLEVIREYASTKSIFGVCLGHQAIGEVFNGQLELLPEVYHGVSTSIQVIAAHDIYEGLAEHLEVGRYHSWVIDPASVPDELHVTAMSDDNRIMSIRHKEYDVHGVQFHPESILTPQGIQIIQNFLIMKNQ